MATKADFPYTQYGNEIGTDLVEQWSFGYDPNVPFTWEPQVLTINGTGYNAFWGRFVIEEDIVEDITVQQIKCHSNRAEFNADGTLQFFGLARYPKTLQSGLSITTPNALVDPSNENVSYCTHIVAKYEDNEFQSGRDDGFLIVQSVDNGLDTSIPITMSVSYYVKGSSTGDIVLDAEILQIADGFVYDGTAIGTEVQTIVSIDTPANLVRKTTTFMFDIEKLKPSEAAVISLKRSSATNPLDTLGDSIVLTHVTLTGYFWR